ncbi:YafY family protein [Pseudoalteromonas sp. MMG012]|uniref:helix-turn-helix transcriptional regulator n=1 Tax=Pseudoalteromonas sp. MMG012 TaxID=2822686 RepID=UPI001B3A54A4|nr:WYL domain-containing protein [Pseudoalteromonas sp. MMG012]MBQ4852468.1 WYL domain-containing protein [Pseudoalteromonas sp. MMG012]
MQAKEEQYFRYIEAVLFWHGEIQTGVFQDKFKLSRPSARRYLNDFIERHDIAARYDESEKAYVLATPFTPNYISQDFSEYVHLIGEQYVHQLSASPISALALPHRKLNPTIIRPILNACRRQSVLDIRYQSIKEDGETERIIRPHTLVNSGLRYHLRAYCEDAKGFRDFSLSRILAACPEFKCKAQKYKQDDDAWQREVILTIMPDPRLSDYAQQVVAHDFDMQNHKKRLTSNAALINYLISILRLDVQHPNPEAQQIVMEPICYSELRALGLLWN